MYKMSSRNQITPNTPIKVGDRLRYEYIGDIGCIVRWILEVTRLKDPIISTRAVSLDGQTVLNWQTQEPITIDLRWDTSLTGFWIVPAWRWNHVSTLTFDESKPQLTPVVPETQFAVGDRLMYELISLDRSWHPIKSVLTVIKRNKVSFKAKISEVSGVPRFFGVEQIVSTFKYYKNKTHTGWFDEKPVGVVSSKMFMC